MQILKLNDDSFGTILTNMLKRSPDSYPQQEAAVAEILKNVRTREEMRQSLNIQKSSMGPISIPQISLSLLRKSVGHTTMSIRN